MSHKISADGRRHLASSWRDLIDAGPSGDLDVDLRVALLALWIGGDRQLAAEFLCQSAARRLENISSPKRPDGSPPLQSLALWYRRLRLTSAEALVKGESAAALAMARALPRSVSGKQERKHTTPGS
jgi:hypothetical protein